MAQDLLATLAEAFRESGHDLNRLTRWIVSSEAYGLDSRAGDAVRTAQPGEPAHLSLGRRGAYLCIASLRRAPGASEHWNMVGDTDLDHADVTKLARELGDADSLTDRVEASLERDHQSLAALLDGADGAQVTADAGACAAHRSNVLFNAMRGGVPLANYAIDALDFCKFVRARNSTVADRHGTFLDGLPAQLSVETLPQAVAKAECPQLTRLAMEYLPLPFGRRHGDPSRPWNQVRIKVRDDNGERVSGDEGNWRDIFQNWEALTVSYPHFAPAAVARFLNASTADGYNPYRIPLGGVDWEVHDPEDPWSFIGYWGDHQVVYLARLVELAERGGGRIGGGIGHQ